MQQVLEKAEDHPPHDSRLIPYLEENPLLSLNGEIKRVIFTATSGLLKERETTVEVFPGITEPQLHRKLQDLAKAPLTQLLLALSEQVGVTVKKVQIRDQRSRWGSCARRGNISLNWRIILMPHELQKHILLHELAHIPHPDHSQYFWDCLTAWDPDTPRHRVLLREHGNRWIQLGRLHPNT